MEKFENQVKELKFKVLKSIALATYNETDIKDVILNTPKEIVPGPKATMRCCIYKERAVVQERISLGLGGHNASNNILEVIDVACDECPLGGYEVTSHCRACVARNCLKACRKNAIEIDLINRRAHINKDLCVNCGLCARACEYNAIMNFNRPCESSCAVKAISCGENGEAVINDDKCVGCGQCVYKCPFGAIMDKSYIVNAINLVKNTNYHTYAIIAPSIVSSFREASLKQMISAIKYLGFYDVIETSFGAELVAKKECQELIEKGKITSSCCPSFVAYIKKQFPQYKQYISSTLSPMSELAEYIKKIDKKAKIIFIGPCTAKKYEIKTRHAGGKVDITLTFEELQAMLAAKNIEPKTLKESEIAERSAFARGFASSGGVSAAIKKYLEEINSSFIIKPLVISGIKNFKVEINKFFTSDEYNFLEGMSCEGGCVNGPCALYHDPLNKTYIDKCVKNSSKKDFK